MVGDFAQLLCFFWLIDLVDCVAMAVGCVMAGIDCVAKGFGCVTTEIDCDAMGIGCITTGIDCDANLFRRNTQLLQFN